MDVVAINKTQARQKQFFSFSKDSLAIFLMAKPGLNQPSVLSIPNHD
jgi:hypothetical protein